MYLIDFEGRKIVDKRCRDSEEFINEKNSTDPLRAVSGRKPFLQGGVTFLRAYKVLFNWKGVHIAQK